MRVLAMYVMRGQPQALTAAISLSLLAFLIAPLTILSGAIVALVTLRNGEKAGLVVGAATAVATGFASALLFDVSLWSFALTLMGWLPLWLLASFLRRTRSFDYTVAGGLVFGAVALLLLFMMNSDQPAFWHAQLEPMVEMFTEQNDAISEADRDELVQVISTWAAAGFVSGYYLQLMVVLFLARWWQSTLFNPGGFRDEFHRLRLPVGIALGAAAALLLYLLSGDGAGLWGGYLMVLLSSALVLQGLAVLHGVVGKSGASVGWLVAVYVFLFIAMPQMVGLLALIGFSDQFLDYRSRLAGGDPAA